MPRGSRRPARGSQGERLLLVALASHGFSLLGGAVVGPCEGEAPGHEGEAAANRRIRVCHGLVFRQSCREHRITRTRIRDGLQRRRAPAQRVAVARRSSSSSGGGSSLRARVDHRKGCRRLECGAVAAFRCPRDAGTRGGGDHAASCPATRGRGGESKTCRGILAVLVVLGGLLASWN